jgi:hypothetical protein
MSFLRHGHKQRIGQHFYYTKILHLKYLIFVSSIIEDDTYKDLAIMKTTTLSSGHLPPTQVLATGDDKQHIPAAPSICHAPLLGASSQK